MQPKLESEISEYGRRKEIMAAQAANFGRLIQSLAQAKGDSYRALAIAKRAGWGPALFALEAMNAVQWQQPGELRMKNAIAPGSTSDVNWASAIAPAQNLASEFVTYLNPQTILGQIGYRAVPFNTKFPRATSATSGAFVAQGAPIPMSKQAFDSLTLPFAKVNALTVVTDELVHSPEYQAAALISADLASSVSSAMDYQFTNPDLAGVADTSPASITHGATQYDSSGLSAANFLADAKKLMNVLNTANVPVRDATWIMTGSVFTHLVTLAATTGQPAFESLSENGTWLGLGVVVSNAAVQIGSPSEGLLILCHAPSIAVALDPGADVFVSNEAALQMDDAPTSNATTLTSLWQNNLTAVRVSRYCNWIRRRDAAVACVRNINL